MTYADREAAGVALARALVAAEPDLAPDAVVLGVPRGGVVVAAAVARRLGLDLDVALARKVGAPGHPELAIGAVAGGDAVWLNEGLIDRLGVSPTWVEDACGRERLELDRRRLAYGLAEAPAIGGRTAVVVDDGVATGATLAVVLGALAALAPRRLICAVPVAPPDAVASLARLCDRIVCPLTPHRFGAVGAWYRVFTQTSDAEVIALLRDMRTREHRDADG
jgi:putative phosphoribosyl transferase